MPVWILMNGGGMCYRKVHTRTGEQLWDSWSRESGFKDRILWVYLYLDVCVCVCGGVKIWPSPDTGPIPWQPSFALNSVPSAWLGDNTLVSALDGPYEGPTSPRGPVSHPHTGVFWFPWLAPHLVLRGAGIVPQELIAYLITVGNTWPFLQGEEDEEEGQKKKRAKK